jgi:arylsulfatase
MADDFGIWNIGAYHRGMMTGRTPNLDKLAAEGPDAGGWLPF